MTGFGRIVSDLNEADVQYVLVGGIAAIRHGVVRATRDVDAVVAQAEENRAAIRSLVKKWDATRPDGSQVPEEQFAGGRDLHLLTPHGPLDLLADRPTPLSFSELRHRADVRKVDGAAAPIVSLADLVALKRLAGREQDLIDIKRLEEAHGSLPEPPSPRDGSSEASR